MALNEGLKQKIDLIGMLDVMRQREQTEERRKQQELENEMMRQQMGPAGPKSPFHQVGEATVTPDPTAGMGPGEYRMWQKQKHFLSEMPGYIGGVTPEQYSAEQNAIRVASAGAGGRGGGGGGQTQEEADLLGAQTNLADEQGRMAQYQRQGYGSATAERQAEDKINSLVEAAAARGGRGNPSQMLGLGGGPNVGDSALRQSVMSGQEIQSPEGYSAGWDRDRNIAEATRAAELEREKFLLGGGAMSDKIVPPDMQVGALAGKRAGDVAGKERSARTAELRRLAFNKIKEDPYLSTAPPQVQQAAADFDDKQRSILSDIIGGIKADPNATGKPIKWDTILGDIADGTLR